MKRTVTISKWAKYALASASSIVLLATAFTSSALAEVKDGLDSLASNPLNQLAQTEDVSIQGSTQPNADTVSTWDPATKTLTMNKDATEDELHADILNHVDEMEVFDFGEGHTFAFGGSSCGKPLFTAGEGLFNSKLTAIKGTFTMVPYQGSYDDGTFLELFFGCTQLKDVSSLGSWIFPKEYFKKWHGFGFLQTFAFCESIDNWDFLKSWFSQCDVVEEMESAFAACSSMKIFDAMKDADISNCGCRTAFLNCTSLEVLDISNWASNTWDDWEDMAGMFAVANLTTGAIEGSLPNLYQITMGNDFLPTADSYFPYSDGWNAYYNGEIQATISSKDELAAYQASAKAKGWGPTTYVKVGHDPYVPTPDPGPDPEPTPEPAPEPTPASDDAAIPNTGDSTSIAAILLVTNALALFGATAIARALNVCAPKLRK